MRPLNSTQESIPSSRAEHRENGRTRPFRCLMPLFFRGRVRKGPARFEKRPSTTLPSTSLRAGGTSRKKRDAGRLFFWFVFLCGHLSTVLSIFEITFFGADRKSLPFLIRAVLRQVPIRYQKKVRHFFVATVVANVPPRYLLSDNAVYRAATGLGR